MIKFVLPTIIFIFIIVSSIGILIFYRIQINDRDPVVNIPTPVMPQENAYFTYLQAGKMVVNKDTIGDYFSKDHPEPSLDQITTLVKQNRQALSLARGGLKTTYLQPPVRSMNIPYPYLANYRTLARLLRLEGQVKAGQGDWAGAADSYLDAIQLGNQVKHGSPMIPYLVGIVDETIGREYFWDAIDHLSEREAKACIVRLQSIIASQVTISTALQEEKWTTLASMLETFKNEKSKWRNVPREGGNPLDPKAHVRVYHGSKQAIIDHITEYHDAQSENAKLRFPLQRFIPIPDDPYSQMLFTVYPRALNKAAGNNTQNNMLLCEMALQAYRVKYKAYPEKLAQLMPEFLPSIPDDPYSAKETLQYKRTAEKYLLYSIGPDGKDDGGKPIDKNIEAEDSSKRIGDIVARINKW